jgi:butyrate kinase
MSHKILAINPGSTSTKISIFEDDKEAATVKLNHGTEALAKYQTIFEQKEYRAELIAKALEENNYKLEDLAAIVGRGGLLKPIESGTFEVNDKMVAELKATPKEHASNLGAVIAKELADKVGIKAYIVDPVVVDEMQAVARYTGSKFMQRLSIFHALNQKSCARQIAGKQGKKYEDTNMIVAHLGGGISVGAHRKGKVVDVNNALDGEGPFSPERTGTLPAGQWMQIVQSGEFDTAELKKMIKGKGGLMSYFGTSDAMEIENRAKAGDEKYIEVQDALSYQVAKEIGSCAAVLCGEVDAIIITGGLAYNPMIIDEISRLTKFIAPIEVIPGENEMEALALGGLRVLKGEESAKQY